MRKLLKRTDDTWYFAYGSNLNVDQKERRTGTIRHAKPCRLPGYRLAFNKRGSSGERFANIVPYADREVWGVAYLCSPAALQQMDCSEGVPGGHYVRVAIRVLTRANEALDAVTYIAGAEYHCEEGRPSDSYLQRILSGARQHALPEEYIQSIENLANG
jgi:cation transport regulator ChaC